MDIERKQNSLWLKAAKSDFVDRMSYVNTRLQSVKKTLFQTTAFIKWNNGEVYDSHFLLNYGNDRSTSLRHELSRLAYSLFLSLFLCFSLSLSLSLILWSTSKVVLVGDTRLRFMGSAPKARAYVWFAPSRDYFSPSGIRSARLTWTNELSLQ